MDKHYSLVFRGEIALGQDPVQVRENVRNLLKISPEQLSKVFSGEKVYIKKNLAPEKAGRYKQIFEATGAICLLEREQQKEPLPPLALTGKTIRCPKCGMEQPETSTCAGCGIIIAKFRRLQEARCGHLLQGAGTDQETKTEACTTRAGALGAFVRNLIIITLIIVGGYAGYRQLVQSAEDNVVFTSNDCGEPCQMALIHLQREGVEFSECNIDASKENLKRFRKYRSNTLPLTVLGGTVYSGYQQEDFQILIDMAQGRYLPESAGKVVMYTTSTCGQCQRARNLFDQHGIEYIEHDISDPSNRMRYERLGGRGVPLILIDGRRFDGFNAKVLTEMLREAGIM